MNIKKQLSIIKEKLTNETERRDMQFACMYIICAVIGYVMSILNIFTKETITLIGTAVFGTLCLLKYCIYKINKKVQKVFSQVLMFEILILMCYFIVSGKPEGFSALWCILVTFCALLMFGIKQGSFYSLLLWVILIFFFWTPWGRSLIVNDYYTETFKTRFPVIYFFSFMLSLFLEVLRLVTYNKLKESENNYLYLSMHDALTGLYNRYAFNQKIEKMSGVAQNGLALFIVDIDKFKDINDAKGHLVGDIVLQEVAKTLSQSVEENSLVSRWGGEEFAILLFDNDDTFEKGEYLRKEIENKVFCVNDEQIKITISIGVATAQKNTVPNYFDLLGVADKMLYKAKNEGRNKVVLG